MHKFIKTLFLAKKEMMNIKRSALILTATFLIFLTNTQAALAQDEGTPAMQSVTYFTMGGGAAGAGLGIAYWLLDPLNPSADLTNSALQGFAVGSLLGMIMGIMQLQRQMVLPYQPQEPMMDEFDGNAMLLQKQMLLGDLTKGPPGLPMFQYQLRF